MSIHLYEKLHKRASVWECDVDHLFDSIITPITCPTCAELDALTEAHIKAMCQICKASIGWGSAQYDAKLDSWIHKRVQGGDTIAHCSASAIRELKGKS